MTPYTFVYVKRFLNHLVGVVTVCLILLLFQHHASAGQHLSPTRAQALQCIRIIEVLETAHYVKKTLDNNMSSQIMERYIRRLDPGKQLFIDSDIREFKKHEFQFDNELKRGNLSIPFSIFNRYLDRAEERTEFILSLVTDWEKTINFDLDEDIIINNDLRVRQPDIPSLKNLWRAELKNQIITMIMDNQTPESITERLEKLYSNRLKRLMQTESNDVFQIFMNIVSARFDPHTQYFPPRAIEDFDIHMSKSLEGIGAVLQTEYEYTKVVRLIPKGPADKSALLMPGDKIIGVGQGEKGEIVDTIGQRIDHVVALIRGPKNTFVRLKIIPAKKNTTTRTIRIRRDRVKLEDQTAKKKIVTVNPGTRPLKIGIIEIPNFYIDFEAYNKGDKNYKSTTKDVERLLIDLKNENIDGLIVDLRDNGGGALQEASQLTGLFLKSGPTVQVRYKHKIARLYDDDPAITYTGPLIVMMNRMSASASEIFAGAIKDYNRGIIVGSRSFGKGTVQELLKLDRGRLKLTRAKFYRVSGESTQHQGVLPDIYLPQIYNVDDTGESSLKDALPWDSVVRSLYTAYPKLESVILELSRSYQDRSEDNPGINYLEERIQMISKLDAKKRLSLNLAQRQEQRKEIERLELDLENRYRSAVGKPVLKDINDENEQHQLSYLKAIQMDQTHLIMADFIGLTKEYGFSW